MIRNKSFGLFLFLLLIGCENPLINQKENTPKDFLNLYMNHPFDGNDYLVDYDSPKTHWYVGLEYDTLPMTRVFWFSPDSFTVYHMGYPITEPIINYSTYSRDDGSGRQMIYLNRSMIGKRLLVYGCINKDLCKELSFRLK